MFPRDVEQYFEPFLGGGSVALAFGHTRTVACDQNEWLISTYRAVRDDWRAVATRLDTLANTREDYLRIRAMDPSTLDSAQRAAHFIYLNKTGFRGLFRVNQQGRFNVPYGAYDRRYYDPLNLEQCSAALRSMQLRCGDFEQAVVYAGPGDFVYFDPPYYKQGGFADFNRYTASQFGEQDHLRLAQLCQTLEGRGVRWALSNSDTPFVREHFRGFRLHTMHARREINLSSKKREIGELLITNYAAECRV
jgi:DNA adenine methylase